MCALGLSSTHGSPDGLDCCRFGRVDLVDDHDVGHPDVGLARVVAALVTGTERVGNDDVEIRPVEREVVVAPVPQDDVGLELRFAQDRLVVDAGVEDPSGVEVRLVLLPLLDRRLVTIEVLVRGIPLDTLCGQDRHTASGGGSPPA